MGHGVQAGHGGQRELAGHVEQRGAALLEQFGGSERGAQGQVIQAALAVDGGRGGEEAFQARVGHGTTAQAAVGVRVAVDPGGHHQAVAGIQALQAFKCIELARRADLGDGAVDDQQVGGAGLGLSIRQHEAAVDQQSWGGHGGAWAVREQG